MINKEKLSTFLESEMVAQKRPYVAAMKWVYYNVAKGKFDDPPMRAFTAEESENYSVCLEKILKPTGLNIFEMEDRLMRNLDADKSLLSGIREALSEQGFNIDGEASAHAIAEYWISQYESAQDRIRKLEAYNGRVEKIRGYGE